MDNDQVSIVPDEQQERANMIYGWIQEDLSRLRGLVEQLQHALEQSLRERADLVEVEEFRRALDQTYGHIDLLEQEVRDLYEQPTSTRAFRAVVADASLNAQLLGLGVSGPIARTADALSGAAGTLSGGVRTFVGALGSTAQTIVGTISSLLQRLSAHLAQLLSQLTNPKEWALSDDLGFSLFGLQGNAGFQITFS
jgi:hypothetical protein